MVNEFNDAIMKDEFPDAEIIRAVDEIDCKAGKVRQEAEKAIRKLDKLADARNTAGLEKQLKLTIGVKVMLRKNVNVKEGLVNGSIGYVTSIHKDKSGIANMITVRFEGKEEDVKIGRDIRKVMIHPGAFLIRQQFPLSVAFSLTIHKAQGLSLPSVLADLGNCVFEAGQTYVALSRCKTLEGLHLINFCRNKVLVGNGALIEYSRLGSKPVDDNDEDGQSKKRKRKFKSSGERIWYTTSKSEKAKSTIEADIAASFKSQKTPNVPKRSNKKKTPQPRNKFGAKNNPIVIDERGTVFKNPQTRAIIPIALTDVQVHISALLDGTQGNSVGDVGLQIIPLEDMLAIYNDVLVPWSNSTTTGSFVSQIAEELNPDALRTAEATSKWLSAQTLFKLVSVMQDKQTLSGGPTIFNFGPYARSVAMAFSRSRQSNRSSLGYIEDYVKRTYEIKRFTRVW